MIESRFQSQSQNFCNQGGRGTGFQQRPRLYVGILPRGCARALRRRGHTLWAQGAHLAPPNLRRTSAAPSERLCLLTLPARLGWRLRFPHATRHNLVLPVLKGVPPFLAVTKPHLTKWDQGLGWKLQSSIHVLCGWCQTCQTPLRVLQTNSLSSH